MLLSKSSLVRPRPQSQTCPVARKALVPPAPGRRLQAPQPPFRLPVCPLRSSLWDDVAVESLQVRSSAASVTAARGSSAANPPQSPAKAGHAVPPGTKPPLVGEDKGLQQAAGAQGFAQVVGKIVSSPAPPAPSQKPRTAPAPIM